MAKLTAHEIAEWIEENVVDALADIDEDEKPQVQGAKLNLHMSGSAVVNVRLTDGRLIVIIVQESGQR